MTYNEYLEKRKALSDEAQGMIDAGNIEDAKAKMAEMDNLDKAWDETAQAISDLNALSDNQRVLDINNVRSAQVEDARVAEQVSFAPQAAPADEKVDASSEAYKNAWAKMMMGKKLTDSESNVITMVNAALTTVNTGSVIPQSVADGIWDLIEEEHPLWADAQKTYVNGNYTMVVSDTSSDAAWYDEATNTADGSETFRTVNLTGCELARDITISWKLREMAIEDFIPFIQRKLAKKMGAALSYGVAKGKGQPGSGDSFKPEPKGIITALKAETSTPQVVTYTAGSLAYANLTAARAKIKAGSRELRIYANSKTIWDDLANVKDANLRPIMVADPVNGGIARIFGIEVKEEDAMDDGDILFSAPGVGYIANVNKDMSLTTEEHAKARTADYCAYAIVDGDVTTTKAHALLTPQTSQTSGES